MNNEVIKNYKTVNPFKPSLGSEPPELLSRNGIIEDVIYGITQPIGSLERFMLFEGYKGVGKTVLLTECSEIASRNGFISVDVTAEKNFLPDLILQLRKKSSHILPSSKKWEVSQLSLPYITASLRNDNEKRNSFRIELEEISELLEQTNTGIYITLDEVHKHNESVETLASTLQHFVREKRNIAAAFAGLPSKIDEMLSDSSRNSFTFVRKMSRETLGYIPEFEVVKSFEQIFSLSGKKISKDLCQKAAEATSGYPLMIQLVGYFIYKNSQAEKITKDDVEIGIQSAKRKMGSMIYRPSLNDLSSTDKTFLAVMSSFGDQEIPVRDIAMKMNVDLNYLSVYRDRLIKSGIVVSKSFGKLSFALPFLEEYLKEHVVTNLISNWDK
jgi:hypothetical protein